MKFTHLFIIALSVVGIVQAQNISSDFRGNTLKNEEYSTEFTEKDSLMILNLLQEAYAWNASQHLNYFNIGKENEAQTIYTEVDWELAEINRDKLLKSNFFTSQFIENYDEILLQIDENVRNKKYQWEVGSYPPFGLGADEWCDCQDYEENFWENFYIRDLDTSPNYVILYWDWDKKNEHGYEIHMLKEENTWKIDYLYGFDKEHY